MSNEERVIRVAISGLLKQAEREGWDITRLGTELDRLRPRKKGSTGQAVWTCNAPQWWYSLRCLAIDRLRMAQLGERRARL